MKEKKPNKTRQISLYMTEEMYNFLATQENASAYIRKAIEEKRENDANPIIHYFPNNLRQVSVDGAK